jgi:type IV secretion system protein VirB10
MSQNNTPGNEPNNGNEGYSAHQGASEGPTNPYYGQNVADNNPNLDAAAPTLRSAEEQRLNRKALAFLGGILVLIVAMGFLLFRKGSDDAEGPAKVNEQARVSTPDLPTAAAADHAAATDGRTDRDDAAPAAAGHAGQSVSHSAAGRERFPEYPERIA